MNYSSAWFEGDAGGDMREAQHAKVRRALRMAGVQPGDRVLEIGCGWGALAEMATTEFGATLTGVTLSTEQLAFAQKRMARMGWQSQGRPALQDYRDIDDGPTTPSAPSKWSRPWAANTGPPISSRSRLLKPGGKACIQSIVIDDACSSATSAPPTSSSSTSSPAAACPARASSARGRGGGPARGGRVCLWARTTPKPSNAGASAFWRRSCSSGFDQRFMHIWEFYLFHC
jgi:cyclopropane-fatty-acyl-phospholipid synthase